MEKRPNKGGPKKYWDIYSYVDMKCDRRAFRKSWVGRTSANPPTQHRRRSSGMGKIIVFKMFRRKPRPEVDGNISFKTSEHRNALVSLHPSDGRRRVYIIPTVTAIVSTIVYPLNMRTEHSRACIVTIYLWCASEVWKEADRQWFQPRWGKERWRIINKVPH
jgi:hypothetical protein